PNIGRMFAGSGALHKPLRSLSSVFFNDSAISPKLRELLTLRIAHRMNAMYVLGQHAIMGRGEGLTEAQMEAISGDLPSPEFSEAETAAILLVDKLVDCVKVPENVVLDVYKALGETAMHEIFILSGFYQMAARYTESLRIDHDAGTKGDSLELMRRRKT
ncbi:MAG: carboxymuconolactone decarboxylase family protein, partial [Nitrospira sp.]